MGIEVIDMRFAVEHDYVKDVERVKDLYDAQVIKVKNEEYIKDLLFEDLADKIRLNRSRYDVVRDVVKKATGKDKYSMDLLTEWIAEDFFGEQKVFEITEIISMGYETYAYDIKLNIKGQDYYLEIPMVSNFTTNTLEYSWGKFRFSVCKSNSYRVCKVSSWRISDIAEYIKKEILDNGVVLL